MPKDDMDRELDAALSRYAAVELRGGLEQRVLAHLRLQHTGATRVGWRHWIVLGFAAASLAALAIWAGERHSAIVNTKPVLVQHEAAKASGSAYAAGANTDLSFEGTQEHLQSKLLKGSAKHRRNEKVARASIETAPKLAQFPAPVPLTEQEKLLIQFVRNQPQEAALVAQMQTVVVEQEADELKALHSDTDSE